MARDDTLKVTGTTAGQRATWRAAAGGGPRALSAWIREAADAAADGGPPGGGEALRRELVALRADLARGVGNNLNQIAHHLNATAKAGAPAAPGRAAIVHAMADVAAMRAILTAALAGTWPRGKA